MGFFSAINRFKEKCFCLISRKYASRYHNKRFNNEFKNIGTNVSIHGNFAITDGRELIIGKNVSIGDNFKIESRGGVYIGDNVIIGNNVSINTVSTGLKFINLSSRELSALKPVILKPGARVTDNTILPPGIIVSGVAVSESRGSKNALELGENMFFVVSTGRSGTNSIAHFLSEHLDIDCRHEQKYLLNRLSTEFAHGLKDREQVKHELEAIYIYASTIKTIKPVYGECDLKNSNLIPILAEILPKSKFIWLIRRADDFVSSAFARKWFDEYEYNFPSAKVFSSDNSDGDKIFDKYRLEYSRYRLNGSMAGIIDEGEWKRMNCFERNCWYWSYWNNLIQTSLCFLDNSRYFFIKLEEISQRSSELFNFLNVQKIKLDIEITNKAYHTVVKKNNWSADQREVYGKWCSKDMGRWYGTE